MILCRFLIGWYCSVGRRVGCCVGGESTVYNLYCISRIIWFIYTFLSNKKYCKYSNFKLLKWKFLQNCKKEMLRNFAKYYYTNGAKPPKLVLVTWFAFFQMVSSLKKILNARQRRVVSVVGIVVRVVGVVTSSGWVWIIIILLRL